MLLFDQCRYLLHYVLTYGEHGSLIVAAGLSLALYSKFASCPAKYVTFPLFFLLQILLHGDLLNFCT
jgi:hypothetical protein